MRDTDDIVSFLPFSWVGEQLMSVAIALHAGATVSFPEAPDTLREDLREIGPHVIIAPPRFWEAMCSEYQVKIGDAGRFKAAAARVALGVGMRVAERRLRRQRVGPGLRVLGGLAHLLTFRALLDRLGLSRARCAYTGGAALGPELFRFFRAIGLNLKQVYGQTETGGISVLHPDGESAETVGKPTADTSDQISETGEILISSPCVFLGYYKNPEATAQALDGGWLHTGDAGVVEDDGHLVVIDRMRDVLRLADGSRFSRRADREQAQVQPARARGSGGGRGPAVRRGARPDRHGRWWATGRRPAGCRSPRSRTCPGSQRSSRSSGGSGPGERRPAALGPDPAPSRCSTRSWTPTTTS